MKRTTHWIIGINLGIFIMTCFLLLLSPAQMPVHYGMTGQADRIGSKYEYMLFPLLSVLISVLVLCLGKKQPPQNAKILHITTISSLIFLGTMSTFLQLMGIVQVSDIATNISITDNIVQWSFFLTGILFMIIGNLLPKCRRNTTLGLRTKWSLSGDTVWQKSQRFAGITMVLCGLVMMASCLTENSILCMVLCLLWTILWCSVSVIMSYVYYRREQME